uniref:Uncharacterized protein n=1 Tax=Molossus molossus TaxID=27622 RepID=A0A7J8J0D5_MOLMO|nr:hypothetical protein HJG59_010271 [Molossus molossus]
MQPSRGSVNIGAEPWPLGQHGSHPPKALEASDLSEERRDGISAEAGERTSTSSVKVRSPARFGENVLRKVVPVSGRAVVCGFSGENELVATISLRRKNTFQCTFYRWHREDSHTSVSVSLSLLTLSNRGCAPECSLLLLCSRTPGCPGALPGCPGPLAVPDPWLSRTTRWPRLTALSAPQPRSQPFSTEPWSVR